MTIEYIIKLTSAENKALAHVALSQQEWIDNAIHTRCRIAMEDIVKICVEKCLESNIQIPGSKDQIVELAFEQGWVKTLEQLQAELSNHPTNNPQ